MPHPRERKRIVAPRDNTLAAIFTIRGKATWRRVGVKLITKKKEAINDSKST